MVIFNSYVKLPEGIYNILQPWLVSSPTMVMGENLSIPGIILMVHPISTPKSQQFVEASALHRRMKEKMSSPCFSCGQSMAIHRNP